MGHGLMVKETDEGGPSDKGMWKQIQTLTLNFPMASVKDRSYYRSCPDASGAWAGCISGHRTLHHDKSAEKQMSFTLKHLTWAMALAMSTQAVMVASAHAEDMLPGDPLTVTYPPTPFSPNGSSFTYGPGYAVSRQSTLSLSSDALAMLDTARITVSSPGTAHIALDPDGYYMDATFTTGSTKNLVKLDDATHAVLGVNATGGDIVFTAFQAINSEPHRQHDLRFA
jgi:hypothetical protein